MAQIIAVTNQKDDGEKSTIIAYIAVSLASTKKKVLLIDCDQRGNSSGILSLEQYKINKTTYDLFTHRTALLKVIKPSKIFGLDLITLASDVAGIEIMLFQMKDREKVFRKCLAEYQSKYDYILIDCPPSMGLITINALTAASGVIIMVPCIYSAFEELSALQNTINLIKQDLNPSLRIEGILLTMYDSRDQNSANVVQEVRKYFGCKVYPTVINRKAPFHDAPIIENPGPGV